VDATFDEILVRRATSVAGVGYNWYWVKSTSVLLCSRSANLLLDLGPAKCAINRACVSVHNRRNRVLSLDDTDGDSRGHRSSLNHDRWRSCLGIARSGATRAPAQAPEAVTCITARSRPWTGQVPRLRRLWR